MEIKTSYTLPVSFLGSIFLHLLFFLTLAQIINLRPLRSDFRVDSNKAFKVKAISSKEIDQYIRKLGLKNGLEKDHYTYPKKIRVKKGEVLSLSSLKPSPDVKEPQKKQPEINLFEKTRISRLIQKRRIYNDVLKEFNKSSTIAPILKGKRFNIDIDPPKGISENELNSFEKTYYSFQKRSFETYLNSLIKIYNRLLSEKPYIVKELKSGKHSLYGKITYDINGNVISLKIIDSSSSNEIHYLFEETLKNIKTLPNPPRAIVRDRDSFNVYYRLQIN